MYSLESRCSSSVFFSIRPSGEIRSWVESPSTLGSGIIAILALFPLRRLHVYCILCPLARPKSEPTRPRSWLIAVSRRSRAQRELQKASSRSSDAMRSTDVLCRCLKCCVPRTAFSALMGAQRVLGLQLCLMVTSYFQRHTPTSQIENSKYICPRLHRIWVPNTMEPREKIYIGYEIIVFGQILPHKIGVSDLRSPNC